MDDREKQNKTSPEKEDFYSHLNMEDVTDADYTHAVQFCKDFEIKHAGEYHDLFVQSNTLFLPIVFETLEICILKYMNLILQNFFQLLD